MSSELDVGYEVLKIVGGGVIGTFFGHWLATRRDSANARNARERDRLNRINHFRGCLSRWRCQLYRSLDAFKYYKEVVDDIAFECGVVDSDLASIDGMTGNLWKLYSFKGNELNGQGCDGRQILINHIEKIIRELRDTK